MQTPPYASPPPAPPATMANNTGCGSLFIFLAAAIWMLAVCAVVQFGSWAAAQYLLYQETPMPGWVALAIEWGQVVLLALPVIPLAIFARTSRFANAYWTWASALAYMALLALARLLPELWKQEIALAQIGLSLLATLLLLLVIRRRGYRLGRTSSGMIAALAIAPVIAVPWLAWGALGSWLDTLLALLGGLSLGCFAGLLLAFFLFGVTGGENSGVYAAQPGQHDLWSDGIAASITLLVLGTGFGAGGSQLLLLVMLPALGFVCAALARASGYHASQLWLPLAALIGVSATAPLALIDPNELSLFAIGSNETIDWAFRAAGVSLLLAWIAGIVLRSLLNRLQVPAAPALSAGVPLLLWLAGGALYLLAGRPGWYGDEFFVILRSQPDVSAATTMADRTERTRFVYTTLTKNAEQSQTNLRAILDRLGVSYRPYYLVNGIEVNGGPFLRAYLAQQPEVDRILDSPHLRPLPAAVTPMVGDLPAPQQPLWNITMIGADRVWNELHITGKGIVIGQSDSGVQGDHPVLAAGYRGRNGQNDYNWLDPWFHTKVPTDGGGHGTHTLGSALGRNGIGVAPDAEWIGCVNLSRNLGNPGLYLDCLQFMLAPYPEEGNPLKDGKPELGANVLNNSWGCPEIEGCDAASLAPATRALEAAGIFVVASAGNSGPACGSVSDPIAIYANVTSVGAVDSSGNVTDFSSRGPVTVDGSGRVKPDILAPGDNVLSALPDNTYGRESGTSMAGPHVAGVVALMWSAQPKLVGDVERTRAILYQTAKPYSGARTGCFQGGQPNDAAGYGIIDAYAAVKAALALK